MTGTEDGRAVCGSECDDARLEGRKPVCVDAVTNSRAFDFTLDETGFAQDPEVLGHC